MHSTYNPASEFPVTFKLALIISEPRGFNIPNKHLSIIPRGIVMLFCGGIAMLPCLMGALAHECITRVPRSD